MGDNLVPIILALVFSAVFSAVELAFISSNKLHIEVLRKKGSFAGKLMSNFVNNPSYFIGAMLIGNTVSLVIYGIYMEAVLTKPITFLLENNGYVLLQGSTLGFAVLASQTILSTLLVLFVAEFLPKSISLAIPDKLLAFFALPINLIYYLLLPFVFLVVKGAKFLMKVFLNTEMNDAKPVFQLTDLGNYIKNIKPSAKDGSNMDISAEIFSNALEFKQVKVRACMIPRTEIMGIDIKEGLTALRMAFIESGHSKIIIYKDSIDNIIGYCHSLDLFKRPQAISQILTDIVVVPQTMLANELMIRFFSDRKSIALVVDEFGGTSGIVTIEDIIEEIFGDIEDEHDGVSQDVEKVGEGQYLISARSEVDWLNEKYRFGIPEGDYDTLGGYLLSITHNIPAQSEIIDTPDIVFKVESVSDARIEKVKVTIKKAELEDK